MAAGPSTQKQPQSKGERGSGRARDVKQLAKACAAATAKVRGWVCESERCLFGRKTRHLQARTQCLQRDCGVNMHTQPLQSIAESVHSFSFSVSFDEPLCPSWSTLLCPPFSGMIKHVGQPSQTDAIPFICTLSKLLHARSSSWCEHLLSRHRAPCTEPSDRFKRKTH